MKNREYWKKRMELLEEAQLKKSVKYYSELEKQYMLATQEVEENILRWYSRFAHNNNIGLAEAKRMLNTNELAEFQWSVEEFIKHGENVGINRQWMKQLENASAKVHISRLEALRVQIQQQIELLHTQQLTGIDNLAKDIYTEGYYHTAFEIQKGFNIGWDLMVLDQARIDKVISRPWAPDGRNFSERLWGDRQRLIGEVHANLTQSFIMGKAPDEAIRNIARQFDVSKRQTGRLIMTESAAFASAAQKDAFNDLDVERFEIVATLDNRTSDLCQDLDGHVFDMKDFEVGSTAPPFHPWCRTTTVPYFEDDFGERAARGADGQVYYVPSDMKYHEWYNEYITKKSMLPNHDKVVIPAEKFTKYALSKEHKTGKEKAMAFEKALGYNQTNYKELINNIRSNIDRFPAKENKSSKHGKKYGILMVLTGANGKTANVKTGWIIDDGESIPRLVTAYVTSKKV